jgi:hypothetical protein
MSWLGVLALVVLGMVTAASGYEQIVEGIGLLILLLLFAGSVFLLIRAAQLAARLPNRLLTAAVIVVDSYMILAFGFFLLAQSSTVWTYVEQYAGSAISDWRWRLNELASYGMLALAGMLVVLLVWYWWALSRAARFAWATWARRKGEGD